MSKELIVESIPGLSRRIGDRVIEGSNNSTMIFGTDRAAPGKASIESGYGRIDGPDGGKGAGSWHMIVGRNGVDPDFKNDRAFIYLSMRTDADKNMETSGVPRGRDNTNDVSAAILKADSVRIVGRKDIKITVGKSSILVTEDEVVVDSPNLRIGREASEKMMKSKIVTEAILQHTHPTPAGPSGPPLPSGPIIKLKTNEHLSTRTAFLE